MMHLLNNSAIKGLNSTWITKDVLAMQRPSTRLINEHGIVKSFQDANIQAVVNLQVRGEHPLCGDGIFDDVGFSYRPEDFMDHGIFFYNFGWVDMGTPSVDYMLKIVQVMSFTIFERKQKVAVHCHAGYGRTGITIGAWLVYAFGVTADEAIQIVRSRRPPCIQTSKQQQFVHEFEHYVSRLRRLFVIPPYVPRANSANHPFTLDEALVRQRQYLHGNEARRLRHVPKVVDIICSNLTQLAASSEDNARQVLNAFVHLHDWSARDELVIRQLKNRLNHDDWFGIETLPCSYKAQLLLDWVDTLVEPIIPFSVTSRVMAHPDQIGAYDFEAMSVDALATLDRFIQLVDTISAQLPPASGSTASANSEVEVDVIPGSASSNGDNSDLRDKKESLDSGDVTALYERLAYGLMHPSIDLPFPRPFRTCRVAAVAAPSETVLAGLIRVDTFVRSFPASISMATPHPTDTYIGDFKQHATTASTTTTASKAMPALSQEVDDAVAAPSSDKAKDPPAPLKRGLSIRRVEDGSEVPDPTAAQSLIASIRQGRTLDDVCMDAGIPPAHGSGTPAAAATATASQPASTPNSMPADGIDSSLIEGPTVLAKYSNIIFFGRLLSLLTQNWPQFRARASLAIEYAADVANISSKAVVGGPSDLSKGLGKARHHKRAPSFPVVSPRSGTHGFSSFVNHQQRGNELLDNRAHQPHEPSADDLANNTASQ
jgi:Dual specificity phosphatase, catalytic domain